MNHAKQAALLNLSQYHHVLTQSPTGVTHEYCMPSITPWPVLQ